MSSEYTSRPLDRSEVFPGDTYVTTTTTETTYITETDDIQDCGALMSMPVPSSGDFPTNPTTEHHYGANIGTGIYNPNTQNIAHTTYTIQESDFKRTAPDSGEGIHAHQYHARELGSIPVGTTTIIHDSSGGSREIDPEVHARILESEKHLGEGKRHVQKQIMHEEDYDDGLEDRERREHNLAEQRRLGIGAGAAGAGAGFPRLGDEAGPSSAGAGLGAAGVGVGIGAAAVGAGIRERDVQHDRNLQRDREMAIANERERIARERIDTNIGSIHGIYGHGRHRDAVFVGRDTDATDFGNKTAGKIDAHRDVLSTSGSEQDRLIGTIAGRERLAREQDARYNSLLGSHSATGEASHYNAGSEARTASAGPAAYTGGRSGVSQTGIQDAPNVVPTVPETATDGNTLDRTDAGNLGHEGERRGNRSVTHEAYHAKGKPGMMDKIIGNTEAAWGKAIRNPAMTMKGTERATGPARN
ncbi:hypothetical protein D9756_005971 [Leucocoprinus leucothites]|uniref:Uncharacterized protein n=1 Tax=Leucocoprinus leucothites TaxID=201217 RepID=A0A8H5D4Q1_9AGAR|nr:hypothetical protein D9756_005971 [Leucoagaricus leucothites]